jgi:acyl dehydratase
MTTPRVFTGADDLVGAVGERLGPSEWVLIEQKRIDLFAEATGDDQWIHVDRERAKSGPFGATIAHGYLTMSMLPILVRQLYRVEGVKMGVNYGSNRVRFINPVREGSHVRAATEIAAVEPIGPAVQVTFRTTIEIEGEGKPACVAEHISRFCF